MVVIVVGEHVVPGDVQLEVEVVVVVVGVDRGGVQIEVAQVEL